MEVAAVNGRLRDLVGEMRELAMRAGDTSAWAKLDSALRIADIESERIRLCRILTKTWNNGPIVEAEVMTASATVDDLNRLTAQVR